MSYSTVELRIPDPKPVLTPNLILISSSEGAIQIAVSHLQGSATVYSRESLSRVLVLWAILWKSLHEKQLFRLNNTWLN